MPLQVMRARVRLYLSLPLSSTVAVFLRHNLVSDCFDFWPNVWDFSGASISVRRILTGCFCAFSTVRVSPSDMPMTVPLQLVAFAINGNKNSAVLNELFIIFYYFISQQ